jgi:hypothetical protein
MPNTYLHVSCQTNIVNRIGVVLKFDSGATEITLNTFSVRNRQGGPDQW